jgi:hypothetical protein
MAVSESAIPTIAVVGKYHSLMITIVGKCYLLMTAIINNHYADEITETYLWWCLIVGIFLLGCRDHLQANSFCTRPTLSILASSFLTLQM